MYTYIHRSRRSYRTIVGDRLAHLSAILSPISDRFAFPYRQILVQGRDRAAERFLYIAFLVPMETQQLDTQKLVGLKRMSYSGARAVIDALPHEMRDGLNVETEKKSGKQSRKLGLRS